MDYEKLYKEALKKARKIHNDTKFDYEKGMIEEIFPELAESDDEQIRKSLIEYFGEQCDMSDWNGVYGYQVVDWLEKQGEIDKKSYEIAENEKRDFVSGQFIECRKSFNEFKEDNSYWFEYIGNDTYIGRSDNILNKKFHITPRQLYRLFTQQHCPKENNVNEETNATTAYGKYVDECLNEASKHFFSEGEDKYSVADLFYAGVKCGKSWFEKQNEQKSSTKVKPKFKIGDQVTNGYYTCKIEGIDDTTYYCSDSSFISRFDIKEQDRFELVDQETDFKPKFQEGDWIVNNNCGGVYQVTEIRDDEYCLWPLDAEIMGYSKIIDVDDYYHLWTIQDAKDGDILSNGTMIVIFKRLEEPAYREHIVAYIGLDSIGNIQITDGTWQLGRDKVYPATKEQRNLLFKKMKEAGYEWDANKKEPKKIYLKFNVNDWV